MLRARGGQGQLLLVEQDQELAGQMVAGFNKAGVPMDHVSTLQQAVDRCLHGAPDLLILDVALPDGDGFSLVDWLRRQPGLQTLPLVVYSNREISDAEMAKLRLGPTHFFNKAKVKPRQIEELVLSMVSRMRNSPVTSVA